MNMSLRVWVIRMIHKRHCDIYIGSDDQDGGIFHYALSEQGKLSFSKMMPVDRPAYMTIDNERLYCLLRQPFADSRESGLAVYKINNEGALETCGAVKTTHGEVACHLCSVDNNVYCANYITGSVVRMPDTVVNHKGSGRHPRQGSPHVHFVSGTPDGKFICTADLSLDEITVYDKALNFVSRANVPAGHGARHLSFSPDGKTVFCVNELACTITVFAYAEGHLTPLCTYPMLDNKKAGDTASALRLSRDGRYLYASCRGDNSIIVFKVNGQTLSRVGYIPSGGVCPRDFILCGDFIICANMESDNVVVFHLSDSVTARMTDSACISRPICVLSYEGRVRNV